MTESFRQYKLLLITLQNLSDVQFQLIAMIIHFYLNYNCFNIIFSKDGAPKIYHTSNMPQIDSEYTGKHTIGFGNTSISSPYIKVLNGRNKFLDIIERDLDREQLKEELVALLKDKTK